MLIERYNRRQEFTTVNAGPLTDKTAINQTTVSWMRQIRRHFLSRVTTKLEPTFQIWPTDRHWALILVQRRGGSHLLNGAKLRIVEYSCGNAKMRDKGLLLSTVRGESTADKCCIGTKRKNHRQPIGTSK